MSSLGKNYTSPARPETQKSPRSRPPGGTIVAVERRKGPNPIDRCNGKPMCVHKMAMEDKCDSRWVYLSSYLYHQPHPESQKLQNLPRTTPGSHNRRPYAITTKPNLGPIAKNLVYTYSKVARWFISVVRRTCRVIYITSPAQNLKDCKICPERPPGTKTFYLRGNYQTKPRSKRYEACLRIGEGE